MGTCVCIFIFIVVFSFGSKGIYVAFSSITTFLSGKNLFVSESGTSVRSLPGWVKTGGYRTPYSSCFLCAISRIILTCGQNPLKDSLIWVFPAIPEKGHSQNSRVGVEVGMEVTNTNTPSKPINQIALSFITTQFSVSGRNDSLITAEQISLPPPTHTYFQFC